MSSAAASDPRLTPPSLDDLGRRYGTDKASDCHDYCRRYEAHLASRRLTITRVLELGVDRGASLRMWAEYFPNAEVLGIDLHPVPLQHDRVLVARADIMGPDLVGLASTHGPFDLIVDDASHVTTDQIHAFTTLWPFVAPGGLYAIEDTSCAYWPEYQRGLCIEGVMDHVFTMFLLNRVDNLHQAGRREHGFARRASEFERYTRTDVEMTLDSLHVYNSLLLFQKRPVLHSAHGATQ